MTPVLLLLYLPKLRGSPMEMQTATISASWFPLQVQHLKITMVTGFLPMGNGNAYDQLHPGSRCMRQSWYYDKYARVVANVECRWLPSQVPAACSRYIVMPLGLASVMENGECNPGSLPTQLSPGEGPMFYLRVWGTMHRWRRWRTKKIYTSSSLRGSDA